MFLPQMALEFSITSVFRTVWFCFGLFFFFLPSAAPFQYMKGHVLKEPTSFGSN